MTKTLAMAAVLATALTSGAYACSQPFDPTGYDYYHSARPSAEDQRFRIATTCAEVEGLQAEEQADNGDPGTSSVHTRMWTWTGGDCSANGSNQSLGFAAATLAADGCTRGQMCKEGGNGVCIQY